MQAGIQWTCPRAFMRFNKRSVKRESPTKQKTTIPKWRGAVISKRLSADNNASNFCAKRTFLNQYSENIRINRIGGKYKCLCSA